MIPYEWYNCIKNARTLKIFGTTLFEDLTEQRRDATEVNKRIPPKERT